MRTSISAHRNATKATSSSLRIRTQAESRKRIARRRDTTFHRGQQVRRNMQGTARQLVLRTLHAEY